MNNIAQSAAPCFLLAPAHATARAANRTWGVWDKVRFWGECNVTPLKRRLDTLRQRQLEVAVSLNLFGYRWFTEKFGDRAQPGYADPMRTDLVLVRVWWACTGLGVRLRRHLLYVAQERR